MDKKAKKKTTAEIARIGGRALRDQRGLDYYAEMGRKGTASRRAKAGATTAPDPGPSSPTPTAAE